MSGELRFVLGYAFNAYGFLAGDVGDYTVDEGEGVTVGEGLGDFVYVEDGFFGGG